LRGGHTGATDECRTRNFYYLVMRILRQIVICFSFCISAAFTGVAQDQTVAGLNIGWASADLTPVKPVLIAGQFHARVSEGVMDPITATVLAIESVQGSSSEQAIMVSCDFVAISDGMRDHSDLRARVRQLVKELSPSIKADQIMLNAT